MHARIMIGENPCRSDTLLTRYYDETSPGRQFLAEGIIFYN